MSKRIVLGVTGSIAAFKAAKLASDMVADGLEVQAVVTSGGARFVAPLTFSGLTGRPVPDLWDTPAGSRGIVHVELASWADALVVAPASANALARLAHGMVDDLLSAVAIATRAPLVLAPAMESEMWEHSATQANVKTLLDRGATVVGPEEGRLASGSFGGGRMSEPAAILEAVHKTLRHSSTLDGMRVLVTAGPTREPIDPVRFIGNYSSGKMGYALAAEAVSRGAEVVLVTGPTTIPPPRGAEVVHVETSEDMRKAVLRCALDRDVIVMAAAVADFKAAEFATSKLRRDGEMSIKLEPTDDIARAAALAAPAALHVGFALETADLLTSAREKLQRKGQSLVVANAIDAAHNPFGSELNKVTLVHENDAAELPLMPKSDVAAAIWDDIERLQRERREASRR